MTPGAPATTPAPDAPRRGNRSPKRRIRPGNLITLKRMLWRALVTAEDTLEAAHKEGDRDGALRAVHAISTAAGTFIKAHEHADILPKLAEIDEWMHEEKARRNSPGTRWAA